MPDRGAPPLFLARRSYRRRRLIDAACLLPAFGTALFLVPLLWDAGGQASGTLALRGLYLFGAWAVLISVAAIFARPLRRAAEQEERRAEMDAVPGDEAPALGAPRQSSDPRHSAP